MEYDPIKRRLGTVFNRTPFLRKLFYSLLDLLLLRAWYVYKELKQFKRSVSSRNIKILEVVAAFHLVILRRFGVLVRNTLIKAKILDI